MRSKFLFAIATFLGGCGSFSGEVVQPDPTPTPTPTPTTTATIPNPTPPNETPPVEPDTLAVRLDKACAAAKAMLVDSARYDNVLHPVNPSTLEAHLPGKWYACPNQSAAPIFVDSGIVLHADGTSASLSYDERNMTITEQGTQPRWTVDRSDGWLLGAERVITSISTDKKEAVMAREGTSAEGIFVRVD